MCYLTMHYTYYHMESFDNLKKASVQGLVTIETTRSPSHKSTGSHAGASKKKKHFTQERIQIMSSKQRGYVERKKFPRRLPYSSRVSSKRW